LGSLDAIAKAYRVAARCNGAVRRDHTNGSSTPVPLATVDAGQADVEVIWRHVDSAEALQAVSRARFGWPGPGAHCSSTSGPNVGSPARVADRT
jgi:hypothetical protein